MFFTLLQVESNKNEISQKVLNTYELANPGADLEIMSVEEVHGVYMIRLSVGKGNYQTVYTTKDGEMFTQALTNLTQYTNQLEDRKSFLDCLRNESVKIYGGLQVNNTQIKRASALQIQILGGANYLNNIYVDCSNNLQACVQQGVKTLPSVMYDGKVYGGVKQYQWFKEKTKCSM